ETLAADLVLVADLVPEADLVLFRALVLLADFLAAARVFLAALVLVAVRDARFLAGGVVSCTGSTGSEASSNSGASSFASGVADTERLDSGTSVESSSNRCA